MGAGALRLQVTLSIGDLSDPMIGFEAVDYVPLESEDPLENLMQTWGRFKGLMEQGVASVHTQAEAAGVALGEEER